MLEVAPELIGCTVEHQGCSGVIVETEAYHESEPACHAYNGLTPRTEVLFGSPGVAYVYRSYGIHALLNAVCEEEGVGAAVLIRALAPLEGVEQMRVRRGLVGGKPARDRELCSGPGKLTQALGIWLDQNGGSLARGPVRICERAGGWRDPQVAVGTRVGITHAVELPWRFAAAGNPNVSRAAPAAGRRRERHVAARSDIARGRLSPRKRPRTATRAQLARLARAMTRSQNRRLVGLVRA